MAEDQEKNSAPQETPPPLSRNLISYLGWTVTAITATVLIVLILIDILAGFDNPYNSLVTYLILPGFVAGGVVLILAGVLWEWRRRHQKKPHSYPKLPTIDFNETWQGRRVVIGGVLLVGFFSLSALRTYHAYNYT